MEHPAKRLRATGLVVVAAIVLAACKDAPLETLEVDNPALYPAVAEPLAAFDLIYYGSRADALRFGLITSEHTVHVFPCHPKPDVSRRVQGWMQVEAAGHGAAWISAKFTCDPFYRQRKGFDGTANWRGACAVVEARDIRGRRFLAQTRPGALGRVGELCNTAVVDPTLVRPSGTSQSYFDFESERRERALSPDEGR